MEARVSPNIYTCPSCGGQNSITLTTYKRFWRLCRACGDATPQQRKSYPWRFLPVDDFKKNESLNETDMYDYFTDQPHIDCSMEEGQEFIRDYLDPHDIGLKGKRVLDISGGNGHVADQMQKKGADATLTEINEPALRYARDTLGIDAKKFNFNEDRIEDCVEGKYDIICARAAVMFCQDLSGFLKGCREISNDGAVLIIDRSVKPTLGVFTRVQLDEFSYLILRQPESVIASCEREGFKLAHRHDEVDPSMYVYDHDLTQPWLVAHYWYEIKGARKLLSVRDFDLPARDRRRSTLIFRQIS